MVGQIAYDGQLTAIERGIAKAVDTGLGLDLQRDEVAAR